ncbi:MAG TPA: GNAT family N-acetyltransferase [Gryllotalpicola sp.]
MSYLTDDDKARLDLDWIWRMLSTEVYWGQWRSRTDVDTQIETAWRVVGVYDETDGAQVGFCRAVSDGVAFAYLADVIIDPGHRGHGLGKRLVRAMIDDGPGAAFRWTLFTRDAHGLYEQFGFGPADESAMVRASTQ